MAIIMSLLQTASESVYSSVAMYSLLSMMVTILIVIVLVIIAYKLLKMK